MLLTAIGCRGDKPTDAPKQTPHADADPQPMAPELPKLVDPVPFWTDGQRQGEADAPRAAQQGYLLYDLGDAWTPYLFSEQNSGDDVKKTNAYRQTYLALANGEFPDNRHGRRARRDKYLELYGILPTLSLLRDRFNAVAESECAANLDLEPLKSFEGFLAFRRGRRSTREKQRYDELNAERDALSGDELEEFEQLAPKVEAIMAAQARLACEGHFEGKKNHTTGVFDWQTHEALAEFERRHRIYAWGFIGRETLQALRKTPKEVEHEAVVRVLTERAMHAAGVVEDGTVDSDEGPPTYTNAAGQTVPVRNLQAELRAALVRAFGLQTPDSTLAWLKSLGDLSGNRVVAFPGVSLPEYYNSEMDLSLVVDRGDVWYEFPYDEKGKERSQPIRRRPKTTLVLKYNDQRIPLMRHGTTVGGWRSDFVDGVMMWKYKGSPVGDRVIKRISAAPVWVPPDTTPPKAILRRAGRGRLEIDYHETGPSYASAYGLVAAYHRRYGRDPNGNILLWGDQGIRTHGSVDYMSIMRRHSHGCHRLHNHIAVRLMSFVLKHRPHTRRGQQIMDYERELEYEGKTYTIEFKRGGYIFELNEPLHVNVLKGRIKGSVREPIEHAIPKYDPEFGAYVTPNGQWVYVDRAGTITPRAMPAFTDAGVPVPRPIAVVPDGGVAPVNEGSPLDLPPLPGTAPAPVPAPAVDTAGSPSADSKPQVAPAPPASTPQGPAPAPATSPAPVPTAP